MLQVPVETLSGKRSATDGEPEDRRGKRKNNKQLGGTKGRRDDGMHELRFERGPQQERHQDHGREAAQRRPQGTLRPIPTSAGSQRRHLHVLVDQARGTRVQESEEQMRAYSEQASKGKGHDLGPLGLAAFTGLLQALSERCSAVGPTNAAAVANFKQIWDDLESEGAFGIVPHCILAKVYDLVLCRLELVISVTEHREHTRGALGQTGANRLLGQALSGTLERAPLSSALERAS